MEDIDLESLDSPHAGAPVEIEEAELSSELELVHAREHLEAAATELTQASDLLMHHADASPAHLSEAEAAPPAPISWDDLATASSDTVEPFLALAAIADVAAAHDACVTTPHDPGVVAPAHHSAADHVASPVSTPLAAEWSTDLSVVSGDLMGDSIGTCMPHDPTFDATGLPHSPTHLAVVADTGGFTNS